MIKVCHMTSVHDSKDVRIFYKECVSLAKAGFDTYLVAPGESREELGVHVIGACSKSVTRIDRIVNTSRNVYKKALALDADIYHFHDPELLLYGMRLKQKGKRVIFDSHENYTMQIENKQYLPKLLRKIISGMYYILETYVSRQLDAVIIPCTFERKNIFENRAKEVVFITNYPIFDEFYNKFQSNIKKENMVCYIGGLTYDRGIYHLIRAAALANVRLALAGNFFPPSFESQVRALKEFSNVDYYGLVSRNEVRNIDQKAIAGICTLLKVGQYDKIDTFGIKVFEYMAMGLPVILTDYPYAQEILKKYKFGICVAPDDFTAISKALIYIKDNPREAHKMGLNGRKAILEEFNWNTQEVKLLALYSKLLKR